VIRCISKEKGLGDEVVRTGFITILLYSLTQPLPHNKFIHLIRDKMRERSVPEAKM